MTVTFRLDVGRSSHEVRMTAPEYFRSWLALARTTDDNVRLGKFGLLVVDVTPDRHFPMQGIDVTIDHPPLREISAARFREEMAGSDGPLEGARITHDGTTVLVLPVGAVEKATARETVSEVRTWFFDGYDGVRLSPEDRQGLHEAGVDAGIRLRADMSDAVFLRTFQRKFWEGDSQTFAATMSAITGYRRHCRNGRNLQGDPVKDAWFAALEGSPETELAHLSVAGYGGWIDLAGTVGRAEVTQDLPPVADLDGFDPALVAAAVAWIDHAPIPSFDQEWLVEMRESFTGTPSPRRSAVATAPGV